MDKSDIKFYIPETVREVINYILSEHHIYCTIPKTAEGLIKMVFRDDNTLTDLVYFITENNDKWEKEGRFNYDIPVDIYRIPRLSRQDIKELGWEDYIFNEVKCFKKNKWLLFWFTKNMVSIGAKITTKEVNESIQYYRGKCKNKAELRWVMKNIGVI
jgi:hypothetical protein